MLYVIKLDYGSKNYSSKYFTSWAKLVHAPTYKHVYCCPFILQLISTTSVAKTCKKSIYKISFIEYYHYIRILKRLLNRMTLVRQTQPSIIMFI